MEIRVTLKFDREAKNTVRYFETTNPPTFYQGIVYIQKTAFGGSNYPQEIEVTITPKARLAAVK